MDKKLLTALKAFKLKDEKRKGWVLRNIEFPETVADHSWGLSLLCILFGNEELDMTKVLKIAAVHDIAEAETGDIATRADKKNQEISCEEKTRKELEAIEKISDDFEEIRYLWEEYEENETKEAMFVKDMDKIEMILQAFLYEKNDRYPKNQEIVGYENLDEFFETAKPKIKTDIGNKLYRQIEKKYLEQKK